MFIHSTSFKSPKILKQNFRILAALSPNFSDVKNSQWKPNQVHEFLNQSSKVLSSTIEATRDNHKNENFQNLGTLEVQVLT